MPQQIYEFKNLDEAVSILGEFGKAFEIPLKDWTKERIIKDSVQSNIFRAFRNLRHPTPTPSSIWREWERQHFDAIKWRVF